MEGKIVFEGVTEKGLPITIRYPKKEDVGKLCEFINTLSKEQTFIHYQGETITLEKEQEWFSKRLQEIADQKAVHVLVFTNGKLIAGSDIFLKEFTSQHEGVFGIVVAKEYRGQGIGMLLLQKVLDEAQKNIPKLHLITLEVFSTNTIAQNMYKKFGFQEFGKLPEGIFRKGRFEDCIYMFKKVK